MRTPVRFAALLRHGIAAFFRSHLEQAIIETALRQQLAAYALKRPRPKLSPLDRAFWVALSRLWPRWKNHLVVVRPETVVRGIARDFECAGDRYQRLAPEDHRSRRKQRPHRPDGHGERVASQEDPGRTHETRNPGQLGDGLARRTEEQARPHSAAAMDDLPPRVSKAGSRSSLPQSPTRSIVSRSTQSGQPSEAHGRTELRRDSSAASAVSCSIMWSS